ncbi:ABC transporter permease [Carboxydocella sp. ULO1]|uniref:ABC transporter permease n=1 Tax=Carboxydocella sp. ULO1 TaxID=1926599 RepID=UPI0009AC59E7|nr:ABC transporter permease [Carboxydocella sp. ULO1]GAW29364.1 ABC transporter permease [Carboxydocella sp. ULO1]
MTTILRRVVFLGILIGIWAVIYNLEVWPDFLFPSPGQVVKALWTGFADGTLVKAVGVSLLRLIVGYFLAVIIGLALGLLICSHKWWEDTLGALIIALQSVPSIVWLPLALLWFKMGEGAILFVVTLGGVWTMTMGTVAGIKNVPPLLVRVGKTLGLKGLPLFWRVKLPASVPHLITAMRLAWAFCWRALLAGELIGTGTGLGQVLMWARDLGNMALVLAIMVIIALLGMLTDSLLFRRLEQRVMMRWGLNRA